MILLLPNVVWFYSFLLFLSDYAFFPLRHRRCVFIVLVVVVLLVLVVVVIVVAATVFVDVITIVLLVIGYSFTFVIFHLSRELKNNGQTHGMEWSRTQCTVVSSNHLIINNKSAQETKNYTVASTTTITVSHIHDKEMVAVMEHEQKQSLYQSTYVKASSSTTCIVYVKKKLRKNMNERRIRRKNYEQTKQQQQRK